MCVLGGGRLVVLCFLQLYPKGKKRYHSDSDEESGSDTDMSDEDSPGYPALSPLLPPFPAALALFHAPL